jgi:DNA-binding NarL/FixJ family response regulator
LINPRVDFTDRAAWASPRPRRTAGTVAAGGVGAGRLPVSSSLQDRAPHARARPARPVADDGEARALVADDVALVRLGVAALLEPLGVGVVAETHSGRDLVRLVDVHDPHLLVVGSTADLTIGEVLWRLRRARVRTPVVALVSLAASDDVARLAALGAHGVALRTGRPEELALVVERVVDGDRFVAPSLHGSLIGAVHRVVDLRDDASGLSPREREVLVLLAEGRTNREIAEALSVTLATVKSHLVHLYAKLGAGSRREALGQALSLGLLA